MVIGGRPVTDASEDALGQDKIGETNPDDKRKASGQPKGVSGGKSAARSSGDSR